MNKEDDVTQWGCFQEVADVIGEKAAKFELEKVRLLHLEECNKLDLEVKENLYLAFFWEETPQGNTFWSSIAKGKVPDECKQKPFKPTLNIDKVVVKHIKETFNDSDNQDFIGNLVEELYIKMNPWVNKNHTLKIDAGILSVFDLENNLCDQVSTIELLLVAVNNLLGRKNLNERL
jgi:hypothetical protein